MTIISQTRTNARPFSRSKMAIAAAVAIAVGGVGLSAAPAQAQAIAATPASVIAQAASTADAPLTDGQLEALVDLLDRLPEDLKNADPRTTPNYEQRLTEALKLAQSSQTGPRAGGPLASGGGVVVSPAFNLFGCIGGIVSAVATNFIPVAKIVDWFKKAKAIWGSVSGIWKALRSGQFAAEMGTEAAKLIESLLGVGGIVDNCL